MKSKLCSLTNMKFVTSRQSTQSYGALLIILGEMWHQHVFWGLFELEQITFRDMRKKQFGDQGIILGRREQSVLKKASVMQWLSLAL